jgi:hypothetical protein
MAEGKITPLTQDIITARQWAAGQRFSSPTQPQDWFGPGAPMPPAAPESVKGRQWDYPAGANLDYIPRGDQAVSFAQLRALALNCDLVRLVIETRKDQLCKMKWVVKAKEDVGGSQAGKPAPLAQTKAATALLKRPDRVHSFNQWLRMLLDDMFTIDAASIYSRPNKGGGLYALDLLDGATIRPVIDAGGRTPMDGPAYVQVLKGVVTAHYDRQELLYLPRNPLTWRVYGLSPVEQIVLVVNTILRRQMHLLQYYTEGNLPDALLTVPADWSTSQIAEWQQYWDALFAGNTAQRRRGTWVPKDMTPHFMKEAALKDPIDEWFARVVCFCFSVSPQPFVQSINRATAETAQEAALSEGLAPVMEWVADGVNLCLETGGFDLVEFCWEEETSIDPHIQAQIDDLDIKNGLRLRSEIRSSRGLDPDAVPDFIMTAQGPVLIDDIGKEPVEQLPEEQLPVASSQLPVKAEENKKEAVTENRKPKTENLAKTGVGKKKVKIQPIDRQRPAVKKAQAALNKLMGKAFKADAKAAAEQLAQGLGLAKATDDDRIDKLLRELALAGITATRAEAAAILAKAAQNGGLAAFTQIYFEDRAIVNQVNKLAVEWAGNRAAELVTKIQESTRDYLRADVTKAMEEGWSSKQLSQALQENFGFSEGRSDMIARTEIAFADCQGNYMAYVNSGVVSGKEWILGSEHQDDDECDDNVRDEVIPLDQAFSSGDMTPPAHPHCVCDFLPVLMEQGGGE